MDAFDDNTFGQPESDPAAEFLAREQDAMAGLDEDLAIPESVTQQGLLLLLLLAGYCSVSGLFCCPWLSLTLHTLTTHLTGHCPSTRFA